ncbi:MAG: aminotransferase class V-fold PLP-dependent enzyme [Gammaproteobacteria bacterium]|nr:aminotransferase class V-fold PLP-dependent enzyme [Gammaproteobacteria bacterium]
MKPARHAREQGVRPQPLAPEEITLDPDDWEAFRAQAHGALDTMVNYLRDVRERPAWQPLPEEVKNRLHEALPERAQGLETVLESFRRDVLPYPSGNVHPRFWSWVSGTGSPVGMLADLLASGMNTLGLGFDDTAPSRVEMQVLDWFKELFGFPRESSGLLVSGGSMANLVGIAVGRTAKAGYDVRRRGTNAPDEPALVVYASSETHSSAQKAVELLGIGSARYRVIPVNAQFEIDVEALHAQIHADGDAGLQPAILIGNAGTVNTGAIDPLDHLADIAAGHDLWYHVDGAFGAIARLSASPPANLRGLERADSLAFDPHKWLHQPYNVGAVLVRHARRHEETFHIAPAYLDKLDGGVAAGPVNFNALGVQLSRSFAALRVWMSFKVYGVERFRALTQQNLDQAQYLDRLVRGEKALELLAPTALNIVNYRYNPGGLSPEALDELNKRLLVEMQVRGIAAPSSTRLDGRFSIRVCITNHRSRRVDFDVLVAETTRLGHELERAS